MLRYFGSSFLLFDLSLVKPLGFFFVCTLICQWLGKRLQWLAQGHCTSCSLPEGHYSVEVFTSLTHSLSALDHAPGKGSGLGFIIFTTGFGQLYWTIYNLHIQGVKGAGSLVLGAKGKLRGWIINLLQSPLPPHTNLVFGLLVCHILASLPSSQTHHFLPWWRRNHFTFINWL